jgi:hypothetical protein
VRYLVQVTECEPEGREFIIPCADLPAIFAKAIAEAKPLSTAARPRSAGDPECFAMLDAQTCRIVDIGQQPDNQALDLGA